MFLHDIVKGAIGMVNANMDATLYRSKGASVIHTFVKAEYEDPVTIQVQIQSLSNNELKQVDFVNLQGERKAIYAGIQLYGIDRVRGVGGDIIEIMGRRWLVVQRLEGWENSNWCKVAVTAQMDKPQDNEDDIENYVR